MCIVHSYLQLLRICMQWYLRKLCKRHDMCVGQGTGMAVAAGIQLYPVSVIQACLIIET